MGCFSFSKRQRRTPEKRHAVVKNTLDDESVKEAKPNNDHQKDSYEDVDFSKSKAIRFTFDELAQVTQNFSSSSFLGEGGFGKVYKGHIDRIQQDVAIKQLDRNGGQGAREFLTEVISLSIAEHINLVKLLGFCNEGDHQLLVYEYMPLGSLEKHLHDLPPNRKALDWNTRISIAAGAARGLEYLHHEMKPAWIYRDLKCSNILLGEGYHPKLSDFGLARLGPIQGETHVSTRIMGTYGYCAPDYAMTGQLNFKSDIYSFGVVLLELISGRKAFDLTKSGKEQNLVNWARPLFKDRRRFFLFADPLLQGQYPSKVLSQVIAIAAMCLQDKASMRPDISDIVSALNFLTLRPYIPGTHSQKSSRRSASCSVGEKKVNEEPTFSA